MRRASPIHGLVTALLASVLAAPTGCAGPAQDDPVIDGIEVGLEDGKGDGSTLLGQYLRRIPCSTSVVRGLSQQIIDEMICMAPGTLESIEGVAGLTLTDPSVLGYLHPSAAAALRVAAARTSIAVSSSMRTIAQQYLLTEWGRGQHCGITVAAAPGTSNHEVGRAVDVQLTLAVIRALVSAGWVREDPADPIHFAYTVDGPSDLKDVLAFQRLWNRNQPASAQLEENGQFDSATRTRLRQAPAGGFAIGACMQTPLPAAPIEVTQPLE